MTVVFTIRAANELTALQAYIAETAALPDTALQVKEAIMSVIELAATPGMQDMGAPHKPGIRKLYAKNCTIYYSSSSHTLTVKSVQYKGRSAKRAI